MLTVAQTGTAAVLIHGDTVDSELQLFQNRKKSIEQRESGGEYS